MKQRLTALTLFAVAMGFLEAAVVIYLRLHFYPDGFSFPLASIPENILIIEVTREVATIVMLIAVAWITGRNSLSRFAYFSIGFGVWDIFYYVFLKATLNWPSSFLTNDILFLIPLPWVGPVLAPILVSLCIIAASIVVLHRDSIGEPASITPLRWTFISLGGMLILASFLLNASAAVHHQPLEPFNWFLFATGLLVGASSFVPALHK